MPTVIQKPLANTHSESAQTQMPTAYASIAKETMTKIQLNASNTEKKQQTVYENRGLAPPGQQNYGL